MTENQIDAFNDALKADPGLLTKIRASTDIDAVVAIANEQGFAFSVDELTKKNQMELSEEELEGCCATTGTVNSGVSKCHDCE